VNKAVFPGRANGVFVPLIGVDRATFDAGDLRAHRAWLASRNLPNHSLPSNAIEIQAAS